MTMQIKMQQNKTNSYNEVSTERPRIERERERRGRQSTGPADDRHLYLYGHRKARITVAVQENPRSVPVLILELGIPTATFMQDMGSGLLRIALECEKKPDKSKLIDEPLWTAFANGKKIGYASKREASSIDLKIMQMLHAVSMGAGVLPADMTDPNDGELTYMRAHFDRVINSKDSETFYMLNPDGNSGPELSMFFIRI
ncbi:protein MIZU-KUSSEI 1-like [Asparagus officinalis]|uniref:protein MIZU-KUSSEI 1-like n=1 Tax=Asparagus officinalis TaxID=4686 RepID=UPI00098E7A57|nr:protein MIZU-KUSSEI 1-like [Asparagus officinalis]